MDKPQRPPASRFLHRIGDLTSTATASILVASVVLLFFACLVAFDLGMAWESGFSAVATAVTLVMVFVIQHTQSRQQTVTQLKLDELIRAASGADDRLVHIEFGGDDELHGLEQRQVDHHRALRDAAARPSG